MHLEFVPSNGNILLRSFNSSRGRCSLKHLPSKLVHIKIISYARDIEMTKILINSLI